MAKYITEILEEINSDISSLEKYKDNQVLSVIFKHAFLLGFKFLLPEGTPPYKQDVAPQGMSLSNFHKEARRFYVFCRADLTPMKREMLFISMLEGFHPLESEVMILIKDQSLSSKYPNITAESVANFLV